MAKFSTTQFPSLGELSVRDKISKIVGIVNDPQAWEIKDTFDHPDGYGSLVMVRYKDSADMETFGRINGVVIDVDAGAIIASSYGHTPLAVADEITVNEKGEIVLTDITGVTRSFDSSRVKFKLGLEGVILRVYKWGGIVFVSSHTKIDVSRSVWGTSLPFLDIYTALGGPTTELFHENTVTSPICHIFQVVDPSLLVATKQDIGVGYLAYLGPKQMWNVELTSCPYKQTDESGIDSQGIPNRTLGYTPQEWLTDKRKNAGFIPSLFSGPSNFVTTLPTPLTEPVIFYPQNLDLETVNVHLRRGYWLLPDAFYESADYRLTLGEFVTMYWRNDKGHLEQAAMQIQSTAYNWRKEQMRGDAPHLMSRFYDLINNMYLNTATPEGLQTFVNNFPLMLPWQRKVIGEQLSQGPLIAWPMQDAAGNFVQATSAVINAVDTNGNINEQASRDQRAYNIWAAFLMAVPLVQQGNVYPLYEDFYVQRQKLITWLINLSRNSEYQSLELGDYINGHIRRGLARARASIDQGRDKDSKGNKLNMDQLTAYYITADLMTDNTTNIRRMIREIKSYETLQKREKMQKNEARTAYAHSVINKLAQSGVTFPLIAGVDVYSPALLELTIQQAHKLLRVEVDPNTREAIHKNISTDSDQKGKNEKEINQNDKPTDMSVRFIDDMSSEIKMAYARKIMEILSQRGTPLETNIDQLSTDNVDVVLAIATDALSI